MLGGIEVRFLRKRQGYKDFEALRRVPCQRLATAKIRRTGFHEVHGTPCPTARTSSYPTSTAEYGWLAPSDYARASSTMLNGVSAARRTREKPASFRIFDRRPSPACAPSANPTSCESEAGVQASSKPRSRRANRIEIVFELVVRERLDNHPRAIGRHRSFRAWPHPRDRPCRAGNRRTRRSQIPSPDNPSPSPLRISRDRPRQPSPPLPAPSRSSRRDSQSPRTSISDTPAPSE